MARIAVGAIVHETNTFSPIPTGLAAFRPQYGNDALKDPTGTLRGIVDELRAKGAELVPTISAHALTGGLVVRSAYTQIKDALLTRVGEADHVDGVCLALHGAMYVEGIGDGESDLLQSIRAVVGPHVPIVAALDMHANLTAKAVEVADGLVAFRTAPHTDIVKTGRRAAALLWVALTEGARLSMGFAKAPILMPGEMAQTTYEPMATLMRMLERTEALPGVLSCSLLKAHCWQDTYDQGVSAVVVTDGNAGLAQREADRLAGAFWERRAAFSFGMEAYPIDEAIDVALAARQRPILLTDSGDNPTAGGTTDVPLIIERAIDKGVSNAVIAAIWDAEAVEVCRIAGRGASVTLLIGGKVDTQHGQPVQVTGRVRRLSEHGEGLVAVLRLERLKNVDVVLTARRVAVTDPRFFFRLGINPLAKKMIIVKLGYVPARVAPRAILVLGPGCTNCDVTQLNYARVRRPIYPLDLEMT